MSLTLFSRSSMARCFRVAAERRLPATRAVVTPHPLAAQWRGIASAPSRGGKKDSDDDKPQKLDFSDTKEAYRSKTFRELLRHYFVYKLFAFNVLVDNSEKLYHWSRRLLGRRLSNWLMKATVYGQFVAGDDVEAIRPVISRLGESGVHSILDYAAEEDVPEEKTSPRETAALPTARIYPYESEERCKKTMENFFLCIETAADVDGENAIAAIKLTGVGNPEFLERFSGVLKDSHKIFLALADSGDIVEAHITPESLHRGMTRMEVGRKQSETDRLFNELDTDKKGKLNVFEWDHHFQPGRELYEIFKNKELLVTMNDGDMQYTQVVVERVEQLAECAEKRGVRLMIDAEQTYYQPAIRHITVNILMPKYNLTRPVVLNTVQCYRKEAETSLKMDLKFCQLSGLCYGVKLVRGAYMDGERKRATEKGYEDPIWPNKEDTHQCYHKLADLLLQRVKPDRPHVMVAICTHNEDSVNFTIEKMREYGLSKSDGTVVFAQLLGMCDHITFPLGREGYCAYKYVPFGPVEKAIPYLARRANENRSVMGSRAKEEKIMVSRELRRRFFRRK